MVKIVVMKNDPDSSTSSTGLDTIYDEKRIVELATQVLKGRMFIGTLLEKYYVEKISAYRDVVSIADNEHHLVQALSDLLKHIGKFYPNKDWWIGVTKPGTVGLPNTYCLWVDIPEGNLLGKYWFKIRNVRLTRNEMVVSLKIERRIEDEAPKNTNSTVTDSSNKLNDENISNFIDFVKETVERGTQNISNSVRYFFSNVTTPHNIKETVVFLSLLLVACVTGLFEVIKFLCDFLIKFMYAWSHFVTASTPILQIVLNFFENLFKVFFTFIAYMVKPRQQPVQQIYVPPKYINQNHRPSLEYYPRQSAVITELN